MSKFATIALALPGVEQGIACAGTALESRTFLVNRKAFLFLSREHARLKLDRSIADARKRGAEVGAGGWTKLSLEELPPAAVLQRWIAESHRLMSGTPARKESRPARKSARRGPRRSSGS